jgi:hypothetical protein
MAAGSAVFVVGSGLAPPLPVSEEVTVSVVFVMGAGTSKKRMSLLGLFGSASVVEFRSSSAYRKEGRKARRKEGRTI